MAYLLPEDLKRQQQEQGALSSSAPGGGAAAGSSGSVAPAPQPQGTGWVNLQSYLSANPTGGAAMASDLAGGANAKADAARSATDTYGANLGRWQDLTRQQNDVDAAKAWIGGHPEPAKTVTADVANPAYADWQKGYSSAQDAERQWEQANPEAAQQDPGNDWSTWPGGGPPLAQWLAGNPQPAATVAQDQANPAYAEWADYSARAAKTVPAAGDTPSTAGMDTAKQAATDAATGLDRGSLPTTLAARYGDPSYTTGLSGLDAYLTGQQGRGTLQAAQDNARAAAAYGVTPPSLHGTPRNRPDWRIA